MNSLQQSRIRLAHEKYYKTKSNNQINLSELKKAGTFTMKKSNKKGSHKQIKLQDQEKSVKHKLLLYLLSSKVQNYQNQDQIVQYQQFQAKINNALSNKNQTTFSDLVFELLDSNEDGVLDMEDFMKFLKGMASTWTQKQVQQLLELLTAQGKCLNKKQFYQIMKYF